MILYINQKNEIKDVNTTEDSSLTPFEISENDSNPFNEWIVDKICCYKVIIEDGKIKGIEPYVDSIIIDRIETLSKANSATQAQLDYVTMMSDIEI